MTVQPYNPKAAMQVTLTPAAEEHVRKIIQQSGKGIGIRIAVKPAGCSGKKYVVDVVQQAEPEDLAFPIDEVLAIYVDQHSFSDIKGTRIDYVKKGLNAEFRFENPNETGACGCGESFTTE